MPAFGGGHWSQPSARAGWCLAAPELGAGPADRDGEVDILAASGHEDADHVALLVERGAAGIAGVRGRVGLDHALRYAADDPGRQGPVQAVWAADEQQFVPGLRGLHAVRLPQRLGSGRLGADADQRQVVLRVDGADFAAPRAALAPDRDIAKLSLDDVVRRDQVARVAVAPGEEGAAEPSVGLDRENALQDPRGERSDRVAPLQRLLG